MAPVTATVHPDPGQAADGSGGAAGQRLGPTWDRVGARAAQAQEAYLGSRRAIVAAAGTLALVIALLVPIGAAVQVVVSAQFDDRTHTQAIVVLDPAAYWGAPLPVLKARLLHAADLYRSGVAPVVILTGPTRQLGFERGILSGAGVPSADVVDVTTGSDTVGSLRIVAGALRDLGWSAVTIVTDPAAVARAQATAAALGVDAHLSPTDVGPGATLTSDYVARETVALLRFHALTRWSLADVVHAGEGG